MEHDEPGTLARMARGAHEIVLHGRDADTGLRAIVAIHSTALGPALGGTRFYPYPDETSALHDVLRLSAGMTMKAAAAGLDLGGGKAVIIGSPHEIGSEELFRAYGRVVDTLGGRYVTAEDVGTTVPDMVAVSKETTHVKGLPLEYGGSGDPSPWTAHGVRAAMRAVAAHVWDDPSLSGRTVAVQGVGKVGGALARLLAADGAELVISDVDQDALEETAADTGARIVASDEILTTRCDILAPCALGAVVSERTIPRLRCSAIVGSANNQLATRADAAALDAAGITYGPDYVANAGGVVNISVELGPGGYSSEAASKRVGEIFDRMTDILDAAKTDAINPLDAADKLAIARIEASSRD